MKLSVKDSQGNQVEVVLPWEEMEASLLGKIRPSGSEEAVARPQDAETITGLQGRVAEMEEQVARLGSPEHEDEVLKGWAERLTPEAYIHLGDVLGYHIALEPAPGGEDKGEAKAAESAESATTTPVSPKIVFEDPHDEKAWRHLPYLKLWVRRDD